MTRHNIIPCPVQDLRVLHAIGTARYVVTWWDGQTRHRDGSPFHDLRVFSNKRALATFLKTVVERPAPGGQVAKTGPAS